MIRNVSKEHDSELDWTFLHFEIAFSEYSYILDSHEASNEPNIYLEAG